jgi:hypothetical protein
MPARNNEGGVTIRDAYNRCYGAPAVYACAVTSHNNRRGDAGRCFFVGPRRYCFVRQLFGKVPLQQYRGAVFSVLHGPCHDFIRETV